MHTNTKLLIASLLFVGGGVWLLPRVLEKAGEDSLGAQGPVLSELPATDAMSPPLDPVGELATERITAIAETKPASKTETPACIVFGRVVDESDRALAGVQVRLAAYKIWADGREVPRLPGISDVRGWEVFTDEDGGFRFEAPLPTAERTWVEITPDVFHDTARVVFGGTQDGELPPLHKGENALGVFRLATTGVIRGVVTDEVGRPLAGVELHIGDTPSSTYEREATSDAKGEYLIGHCPLGIYGVNAKRESYLSEFVKPIRVDRALVTENVNFRLRLAPTIRGVVVSEGGDALEGAKLWGWPKGGGHGAGATSASDGSFTVYLHHDVPYTLSAELEGYESFGSDRRSEFYEPGRNDVRITLRSAVSLTHFVVVDAISGRPIESFGLEILRNGGSQGSSSYGAWPPPPIEDHPGGEVELAARPTLDAYVVAAPGYSLSQDDVQHEAQGSNRQVVHLSRGTTLSGRIVRDGEPVASAFVELRSGTLEFEQSGPRVLGPPQPKPSQPDLTPIFQASYGDLPSTTTSAADGRFEFSLLLPGTYRLAVSSSDGGRFLLVPLQVLPNATQDLGDLALVQGATILGQVLAPAGRPVSGLSIHLDNWRGGISTTTDTEGRFRFDELLPGGHKVLFAGIPGRILFCDPVPVTLDPGGSQEVLIDARDRGLCEVSLEIDLGGPSPEGLRIYLVPSVSPGEWIELGEVDSKGHVEGTVRAAGEARVQAVAYASAILSEPSTTLRLELDELVRGTVHFDVGSLAIDIPATVIAPKTARLEIRPSTDPTTWPPPTPLVIATVKDGSTNSPAITVENDGHRYRLAVFPTGDAHLTFELIEPNAPRMEIQLGNGGVGSRSRPIFASDFSVNIQPGETSSVVLE